jgi:hypothetical protein
MSNKKNILLCDFDDVFWVDIFKGMEKELNLKIHTIIDYKEKIYPELKSKEINCNFFDIRDAAKGIGFSKYEKTIDNRFNKKLDNYIPFLIDMMSRFDPDGESFTKNEKLQHIRKLFTIWLNYLKNEKIDIFFCKCTPHQVYDYIIFICCKILNIKVLFFNYTYFENLSFLNNDPDNRIIRDELSSQTSIKNIRRYVLNKKKNINKLHKIGAPKYIKQNKLLEPTFTSFLMFLFIILKKFFYFGLSLRLNKNCFYQFKKKNIKFSKKKYFTNLEFIYFKFKMLFVQYNYIKFYDSVAKNKIPKKYIFFASNHQPEASSNSECGLFFYDQYKALKYLNENIPDEFKIIYKEHPSSFNPLKFGYQKRSLNYYKKISSLSKIIILDINYDTFDLIKKSNFVATVSGQIGFEALCKETSTIIFSKTWYSNFKNIFECYPLKKLKKIPFNNSKFKKFNWHSFEKKIQKCLDSKIIRAQDNSDKLNNNTIKKEKKIILSYIVRNFNKL